MLITVEITGHVNMNDEITNKAMAPLPVAVSPCSCPTASSSV